MGFPGKQSNESYSNRQAGINPNCPPFLDKNKIASGTIVHEAALIPRTRINDVHYFWLQISVIT